MINTPYIKLYNKQGELENPINGQYLHSFKNRSERMKEFKKERFYGNGKNLHLSVTKISKYERVRQRVAVFNPKTKEFTGEIRTIEHYLSR